MIYFDYFDISFEKSFCCSRESPEYMFCFCVCSISTSGEMKRHRSITFSENVLTSMSVSKTYRIEKSMESR